MGLTANMSLADWEEWTAEQDARKWRDEDGYRVYDHRPEWAKPQKPRRFIGYDNDVPVFENVN